MQIHYASHDWDGWESHALKLGCHAIKKSIRMDLKITKERMQTPPSGNTDRGLVDLALLVQSALSPAISNLGLKLRKGKGWSVYLENSRCILRFSGILGHRVLCKLHPKGKVVGHGYDLGLYLFMAKGLGAAAILPPTQQDWDDARRVQHILESIDRLIVNGHIDGPLRGDFSWVARYGALESEHLRLGESLSEMVAAGIQGGSENARKLLHRWNEGDFTWIVEARTLLGKAKGGPLPP